MLQITGQQNIMSPRAMGDTGRASVYQIARQSLPVPIEAVKPSPKKFKTFLRLFATSTLGAFFMPSLRGGKHLPFTGKTALFELAVIAGVSALGAHFLPPRALAKTNPFA